MTEATDAPETDWMPASAAPDYDPQASRKTPKRPTPADLRDALANAPEAPAMDDAAPPPASPSHGGSAGGGNAPRPKGEIFENCPVTPLGVRGDLAYFLDANGQMRAAKKMEGQFIQSLFGHHMAALMWRFPKWNKTGDGFERVKLAFDQGHASLTMWQAASECGVFNPDNMVRGVGAWTDDDGNLVYHMGDKVLHNGETRAPGRIGKRIYPAAPPIPHPHRTPEAPDPVPEIMRTLGTWNWTQPDLAPFIILGMIGVQMLGGALDWRAVFWLLAPAGAGKSELQKLLKLLHGDDGLVQSTDATKSGITSKIGHSSLPVSIDELEPGDERSTKERDIIQLARVAASGGEWFRGSSDQTGVGGKVYSAFLFSSILIPGIMKTQDVQRLIKLELRPLDKESGGGLNLQPRTWRARGARLKALLIERWPSWQERLGIWRHALELAGVAGRDADNWSSVLAMADMATNEDMPAADVTAAWARKVAFEVANDQADTTNDAEAMLLRLMGQPFDIYRRGEQHTVAQWIMAAANLPGAPASLLDGLGDAGMGSQDENRRKAANAKLAKAGLRVIKDDSGAHLFIANSSIQMLEDLFRGSQWAGGVWKQSAARVPGAQAAPNPLTLAGIRSRGTLMPLEAIPGLMAFPADRDDARAPGDAGDELEDWTT